MMKLFKNKWLHSSFYLVLIFPTTLLVLAYLEFLTSVNQEYIIISLIIFLIIFLIWSVLVAINNKLEIKSFKIYTLLISLIPAALSIMTLIINQENTAVVGSSITILMFTTPIILIQGGILFKWSFYSYIFFTIFLALFFKTAHLPGANNLLLLTAPLILIKVIMEIYYSFKSKFLTGDYMKLFLIQSTGFILFAVSFWFLFMKQYGDIMIGKILIYLFFVTTLIFLLLLPKSDYMKWDPKLKKRFRINCIYVGIPFLILALWISLSDTFGYDVLNMFSDTYFVDYGIDFSNSTFK